MLFHNEMNKFRRKKKPNRTQRGSNPRLCHFDQISTFSFEMNESSKVNKDLAEPRFEPGNID